MSNNYDPIDEALNTTSDIVESKPIPKPEVVKSKDVDIEKDYEYSRANLYSLIEKGQEAINGIMEVAGEGGSPRAYEVAGQLIKTVSETSEKLLQIQKMMDDLEDERPKHQTTNQNLFVGSTAELQKLLKNSNAETKE